MKVTSCNGRLSCIGCLIALPWLFMVVLLAGCPAGGGTGNDNNNNNNNSNDNGSPGDRGEIITPASSFGLSQLDPPFQVRYSVPDDATDIVGYRFPVGDSTLNSPSIGDKVTIAANLAAGSNKFFDFDPSEADVGYYRVGVSFTVGGDADSADGAGVIQVQGPPDPIFIQPAQQVTVVEQGGVVTVSFDARDPEDQVQWRLFYLDSNDTVSAPPDRIGTQLAIGQGNAGTVSFRTEGLAVGDYTLGLSATDSGLSVSDTVAAGQTDRIVTIPKVGLDFLTPKVRVVAQGSIVTPEITITNPGTADINLFKDATFTIRFTATVPDGTGSVEVFYDADKNVSNGFTSIADNLSDTDTQVEFPTGVPEGSYYIGATIRNGTSAPVTDYSTGKVIVTRTVSLAVTEPNTSLAVAPSSPVTVRWTTNAPDSAGTVDVFAQRLTTSNQPTGSVIPIVTGGAMSLRTATFTSTTSGLFQISVRLNITGQTALTDTAPRPVRVSSLPAIAWLGSIAETNPRLDGAIFGGVNFEDNAGSAFTKADDYDGDGLDEFVIASRYGKPFFVNPSGLGPGEAYLLYGERGSARIHGIHNLNSVGTSSLRGITMTGIRTVANSSETDGLSTVASLPDADDDEKDELAFGFPSTHSDVLGVECSAPTIAAQCWALDRVGQFDSGGVVILSSTNSTLGAPENAQPINLDQVGRNFTNMTVTSATVGATLADRQKFQLGDPDAVPPTEDRCIAGTDGVLDTIIGPGAGFVGYLANPTWLELFVHDLTTFEPIVDGEPAPLSCPTASVLPDCVPAGDEQFDPFFGFDAGSGFYVSSGTPKEPFGGRILGAADGDRFGTSITVSFQQEGNVRPDIIISAPGRSADCNEVEEISEADCEFLDPVTIPASGLGYMSNNRNLWGPDSGYPGTPPRPHQYVDGFTSHCGDGRFETLGAARIVGSDDDNIENLLGIDDFNDDSRPDIAVGAPKANEGSGRLYIAYRRQPGEIGGLEGAFLLSKIAESPDSPTRLDGLVVTGNPGDSFGASLAGGFDFNGDEIPDLVISSPDAGGGTGEVIVLFGQTGIVSPAGGISVQDLLTATRTEAGGPVAVRIRGATTGGEKGHFGFNVANAGDVDGDGLDDLLISAPSASPRFDADPNDGTDELTTLGIDSNLDGVRDQVPGDDELKQAGLVYLILGKNRLDQVRTCAGTTKACLTAADCPAGAGCTLTDPTVNIDQLGTSRLRGLIIAGRRAGDYLGGGDAGDPEPAGNPNKSGRGRSHGLGTAGDVDGDGRADILIGAVLADPRRDPNTGVGVKNGGEAYLIYGSNVP